LRYVSTRGDAPVLSFADVVLAGLARDGGLYVPETWPVLSHEQIAGFAGRAYHEIATEVIAPFAGGSVDRDALAVMAADAYRGFGHEAVAPLVQVGPDRFVLELFHGPTLAFKDVAMRLLARLMDYVLSRRNARATIVGATSGDTGGAAIEAFRGSQRASVIILYPQGRVSDVQRRMMTTPREASVATLAVDGTFDDCQALVKAMFNDHAFRDRVALSGVNSINWARVVAQVPYYFAAATALGAPHRAISFIVPSGNFGDIFAGYVARKMGLPIDKLVIASNANDILPRTVETGVYEKRGVIATMSPSMDIQVSSNFERWLFEAQGRDARQVRGQMASLSQSGRFEIAGGADTVAADFLAASCSEADTARTVAGLAERAGYLCEPHTACGIYAADALAPVLQRPGVPVVCLATAHPAKFPDAMAQICAKPVDLPDRLSHLMQAEERITPVANDLAAVEVAVERLSQVQAGDPATPGARAFSKHT